MRSDRLFLQDMLDAMKTVGEYLPSRNDEFFSDPPLQSHIHRHIMIIGEAAFRLSRALKDSHPGIPWRQIEGMRHVLVHDYFKIDWQEVYDTAAGDIPALRPLIENILADMPEESQA